MSALFVGFGLGFFVAAQLGPLSLLLIRSTLRSGVSIGLAIGAGVAVIDTLYAAAGAAGAMLLAGVGIGSMTWMSILATGVSVARRWVGDRMLRVVDGLAGAGLLGFGGLLAVRTLNV